MTYLIIEHPKGSYHLRADQRLLRKCGKIRSVIHADNTIEAFRKYEKWKEEKANEAN